MAKTKPSLEIVYDFPPNIEAVRAAFPIHGNVVYSYGGKLYNPGRGHVDEFLMAHEAKHAEQQANCGTEAWWERYIADAAFRHEQELEAYRTQYRAFTDSERDRNRRAAFGLSLARDMASPLYGFSLTTSEALAEITE